MTPARFKSTQFRKGTLDFNLEFIKLLQNDLFKLLYITINATIPDRDRIHQKAQVCIFFAYMFSWYQDNSDLGQFGPSQFGPYFIRP